MQTQANEKATYDAAHNREARTQTYTDHSQNDTKIRDCEIYGKRDRRTGQSIKDSRRIQ